MKMSAHVSTQQLQKNNISSFFVKKFFENYEGTSRPMCRNGDVSTALGLAQFLLYFSCGSFTSVYTLKLSNIVCLSSTLNRSNTVEFVQQIHPFIVFILKQLP